MRLLQARLDGEIATVPHPSTGSVIVQHRSSPFFADDRTGHRWRRPAISKLPTLCLRTDSYADKTLSVFPRVATSPAHRGGPVASRRCCPATRRPTRTTSQPLARTPSKASDT